MLIPTINVLRRIYQMAFAHLVYPGAVHSRLHHSLGAYHLMCNALSELKNKGIEITHEEELGAKVAIFITRYRSRAVFTYSGKRIDQ